MYNQCRYTDQYLTRRGGTLRRVIQKWGNSLAVRIPRELARDLGFDLGVEVDVVADGEALVVKVARGRYSLADLVSRISAGNKHPEVGTGRRRGRESW